MQKRKPFLPPGRAGSGLPLAPPHWSETDFVSLPPVQQPMASSPGVVTVTRCKSVSFVQQTICGHLLPVGSLEQTQKPGVLPPPRGIPISHISARWSTFVVIFTHRLRLDFGFSILQYRKHPSLDEQRLPTRHCTVAEPHFTP